MEHLLNVYASSACKRSVAPFLGYIEVPEARGRLTKGLWLVWDYEGDKTLAYYLRRRDCITALAADLGGIPEETVVPTVMAQLFECLSEIHAAGLVHRDVKPANIVLCEKEKRFKLIDLGACADLRTGTNYKPTETILDPLYCPPEEYVLPTDAPHLSKQAAPLAMVMSPVLWQQHRPDCFDTWSAGVILLQLGLPFLRSTSTLRNWRTTFARCGYDVEEWRMRSGLSARQTAILDADEGVGWDLAAGLLRPREVESDGKRGARFVNTETAPRLTPSAALKHPFVKKARGGTSRQGLGLFGSLFSTSSGGSISESVDVVEEASSGSRSRSTGGSRSGSGSGRSILDSPAPTNKGMGRATSTWNWMKAKLFDLEARLAQQASDTQTQTTVVQRLKQEVAQGKATKDELAREERALKTMQSALQKSAKELSKFYASARGFLATMVPSTSSSGSSSTSAPPPSPPPSSPPPSAATSSVVEAATNAIYSGLKFTGRALNAVSDLAAAAERGVARARQEAAARQAANVAFIETLQAMAPLITTTTTWDQITPKIPELDTYAILSSSQRRQAFETYVEVLERTQRRTAQAAIEAFGTLLNETNPGSDSAYEAFAQGPAAKDPRFLSVVNVADRRAAFDAYVLKRRAEEQRALAKAATEAAKREEEQRERQTGIVRPSSNDQKIDTSSTTTSNAAPDTRQLEFLKAEQQRLKEEYSRMEAKLAEMEKALAVQDLVGTLLDQGAVESVQADEEGNVIFKFSSTSSSASASKEKNSE